MEAKKMLDLWKSSYLEIREKIEYSGRDSRWEFDRKKLFDRTDHMASICQDLCSMAQVGYYTRDSDVLRNKHLRVHLLFLFSFMLSYLYSSKSDVAHFQSVLLSNRPCSPAPRLVINPLSSPRPCLVLRFYRSEKLN